jgi:hypothetical protein
MASIREATRQLLQHSGDATILLLTEALYHAELDSRVHFIFDRQDKYEGWMRKAFHDIVKEDAYAEFPFDSELGEIAYDTKENRLPLQAADMHAYLWNRYLTKRVLMGGMQRMALEHIARKQGRIMLITSSEMEIMLAKGRDNLKAFLEHVSS